MNKPNGSHNNRTRRSLLTLALAFNLGACDGAQDEDLAPESSVDAEGEEADEQPIEQEESILLAQVDISSGNTIEFLGFPESDQIGIIERSPMTPQLSADMPEDMSALEFYLSVAPDDAPVPRMLVDIARYSDLDDPAALVADRTLVDTLGYTIMLDSEDVGLSNVRDHRDFCNRGKGGVHSFEDHVCLSGGWCDSVLGSDYGHQSSKKKRRSRSRMAACEGSTSQKHPHSQHMRKLAGNNTGWTTQHIVKVKPGTWAGATYTGAWWKRKINHDNNGNGRIRAWTKIY